MDDHDSDFMKDRRARWLINGTFGGVLTLFLLLLVVYGPRIARTRPAPPAPAARTIELPAYPQRTIISQATTLEQSLLTFTTADDPTTVLAWYDHELPPLGWAISDDAPAFSARGQVYGQTFRCHGFLLTIALAPEQQLVTQTLRYSTYWKGRRDCP